MGKINKLYAVGLGPGNSSQMTPEAIDIIKRSDVIVGYTLYVEQISDLIENKKVISTGMRKEVDRCNEAIRNSVEGKIVSVICSGDSGIYGLASLLIEMSDDKDIEVEVIPGITAAISGGSILGSPLTADFSVISLSDLLTPRELILQRLEAAAKSDIVTVLYNPRSRKRTELIEKAISIFNRDLVCGYVKNAGRKDCIKWIDKLSELDTSKIDMLTTLFIGNSNTVIVHGKMVTRRGYHKKYEY